MPPLEQFHPMIVHFPIVLIMALAAIDVFALWRGIALGGRETYATFAVVTAIVAGATAMLAAQFGDAALGIAVSRGVPESLAANHEAAGNTAATLFAIWGAMRAFVWWRSWSLDGTRAKVVVGVDLVLVALVIVVAYFGGQLVYEHGVNVMVKGG